jgi:hypothetical protein
MFELFLIGSAIVGAVGAYTSAQGQKKADQARIANQQELDRIAKAAREAKLEIDKGLMRGEYAIAKTDSKEAAADLLQDTKLGFAKTMNDTYLSQAGAEAGYMDMRQQNSEGLGGMTAAQGASGTKQNTKVRDIVASQMSQKEELARKQIDRGVSSNVNYATGMKDQALTKVNRMDTKYDDGSALHNLFNQRLSGMDTMEDFADQADLQQATYLQEAYDEYNSPAWGLGVGLSMIAPFFSAGASYYGSK